MSFDHHIPFSATIIFRAFAYLEHPECYTGGNVATGNVPLAGQDEGERSDEEIA